MNLEEKLIGNGLLFRDARLKGKSVSDIDRRIILRIRNEAYGSGYDRRAINAAEMRGERGEWGLRPQPYEAVFKGYEVLPNGLKLRTYDVVGDHRLNGSTLGMVDLLRNGIMPYDITPIRVAYEFLKESLVIAWMQVSMWLKI